MCPSLWVQRDMCNGCSAATLQYFFQTNHPGWRFVFVSIAISYCQGGKYDFRNVCIMSWEIQLNYRQPLDQVFTPFLFHCVWCYIPVIQGIHKRMVRFQKLTRNLFLTLHGHNVHRQQRQLSKFLMRYQQFASHAYCGASFQDGVAAGKGFLCAPFWGVQICDYSAVWVSCTV